MSATNLINFSLRNVVNTTVTASPSSVTVPLAQIGPEAVMVINTGVQNAFVRVGDGSVVADEEAMLILAGEKGVYSRGLGSPPSSHIAYMAPTGNPTLIFIQGEGV